MRSKFKGHEITPFRLVPPVDGLVACVAVAEWSSVLASSFCVCSRDSLEFEPNHGAHRQATLVVDDGIGRRLRHLACCAWAESARYIVNE